MRSSKTTLLTGFILAALLFTTAPFTFAFPDEGMFTPDQIAGLPLRARGLKIPASAIYNPKGGGLTNAILRLSVGCTAEFVSPEGLIMTNHHCGFEALVSASTPQKDLVETGFNSGTRANEIPAKGYSIMLTQRIEDVSAKVKAGTANLSGDALDAALKANVAALEAAEQAKAPAGMTVRIQAIDSGLFYDLYETWEIKDIRVVYAPPRDIGVYGGDPDNFEWTRHTGDFTFLRAYVGPDGKPADYSPNNVPYKPSKYLRLSLDGLKENDFVFVLGFPGGTTRYRESWSIKYARDANFPFLVKWLTALSDSLKMIGSTDDDKRIAFQSDIAEYDNSRKAFDGGALRLRRAHVVEDRQADEARLGTWIAASAERQKKYGTVLGDLESLSEETNATSKRDVIIRRFPDQNSMAVFPAIYAAATAIKAGRKLTDAQKAQFTTYITTAFAHRDPVLEREMLKFFFKSFDELPADQRFIGEDQKFAGKTGRARAAAEDTFANDLATGPLSDPKNLVALFDMSWSDFQAKHPFTAALVDEHDALQARTVKFNAAIDALRLKYMEAMAEMKHLKMYPDANFTMRFTYGNVKGYQSREAEYRSPFTTLKGVIEKDTGEIPFDAPQKLKNLQADKDFGPYGSNGTVPVNFLSTTDIIGGNSGSPVLNGNGEEVGICFDGNFEGLGNDFYYDPNVNRTISVDVRYILFVLDKFSGAHYLVDEIKPVGGRK